jgi:hypothetical protein
MFRQQRASSVTERWLVVERVLKTFAMGIVPGKQTIQRSLRFLFKINFILFCSQIYVYNIAEVVTAAFSTTTGSLLENWSRLRALFIAHW